MCPFQFTCLSTGLSRWHIWARNWPNNHCGNKPWEQLIRGCPYVFLGFYGFLSVFPNFFRSTCMLCGGVQIESRVKYTLHQVAQVALRREHNLYCTGSTFGTKEYTLHCMGEHKLHRGYKLHYMGSTSLYHPGVLCRTPLSPLDLAAPACSTSVLHLPTSLITPPRGCAFNLPNRPQYS